MPIGAEARKQLARKRTRAVPPPAYQVTAARKATGLEEAAKVLHALARHGIGGTSVAAFAELPREEQNRAADLLTRAADIAAKAHIAAGQAIDLEVYGVLCDRLNRVFCRLGLERRPRDVTSLPQYLAAQEASSEAETEAEAAP